MKFTISYKFKLKMAQNLSGWSGPVQTGPDRSGAGQGRSVPVVPVRCRSVPVRAGQGRSVPVPVPLVPPVPVPTGADRCRSVPVPLTDRKKRCISYFLLFSIYTE